MAVQRIAATTVVEIDKGPQQWLKLKGSYCGDYQGGPLELVAMLGGACGSCVGATSNSAIGCVPRQRPHLFPSFVLCE